MNLDILIKGGHVVDPSQNVNEIRSIGIIGNKIANIENEADISAKRTINASGYYVFPGLIDFHTHLNFEGSSIGVPPDCLPASGVTAAVDAGSSGCLTFPLFYKSTIIHSMTRVKAYLSCYSMGLGGGRFLENFDPALFDKKSIARTLDKYHDCLLGLKMRLSKPIVDSITPLVKMIELADELDVPVCVHTTNPPCTIGELANTLRKGDIFCHMYHGKGDTILNSDGKILPEIIEARIRGVIFDMAHGNNHFSNSICLKSLEQGFYPDVISTDMTWDKMFYSLRARSLPFVISKFLSFGMSMADVVRCVTEVPAKIMRMEGLIGTLKSGAYADVSIFRLENKQFKTIDCDNMEYICNKLLIPQMTIIDGDIVFGQMDFNLE